MLVCRNVECEVCKHIFTSIHGMREYKVNGTFCYKTFCPKCGSELFVLDGYRVGKWVSCVDEDKIECIGITM